MGRQGTPDERAGLARALFGPEMLTEPEQDDYCDPPEGVATHWPSIKAADAEAEWTDLHAWVEQLQDRFDHLDHHVIPACWWRHNEHVEGLAALRDHERASYSDAASGTAPVEWLRALRDVTALLRSWTSELACSSTHQDPPRPQRSSDSDEWRSHAARDVAERHQHAVEGSA